MTSELDSLRERAARYREKNASKMREGYHYAKLRGFSPSEAAILMGRSKDYIDRLVQEREAANGKTS